MLIYTIFALLCFVLVEFFSDSVFSLSFISIFLSDLTEDYSSAFYGSLLLLMPPEKDRVDMGRCVVSLMPPERLVH